MPELIVESWLRYQSSKYEEVEYRSGLSHKMPLAFYGSFFFSIVLLGTTFYFLLGGLPLLVLKHDLRSTRHRNFGGDDSRKSH
jgi:hypothetical protein